MIQFLLVLCEFHTCFGHNHTSILSRCELKEKYEAHTSTWEQMMNQQRNRRKPMEARKSGSILSTLCSFFPKLLRPIFAAQMFLDMWYSTGAWQSYQGAIILEGKNLTLSQQLTILSSFTDRDRLVSNSHLHARIWSDLGLYKFCACCCIHYEFICAATLLCSNDTDSLKSSTISGSYTLFFFSSSTMTCEPWKGVISMLHLRLNIFFSHMFLLMCGCYLF